jgi:Protein of unknown function (DUF1592)/Protein of unknown function (DUF1588)/Protein of unknown function (DUF1587)/Protein of unknown function (DUF1585)/Protein of unknown function (DUF1595)
MQPQQFSSWHPWQKLLWRLPAACLGAGLLAADAQRQDAAGTGARAFKDEVKPLVGNYCLRCHSTEKHKGEIDLEQFVSPADVFRHPKPWEQALEKLVNGEMPPKDKPQPTPAERQRLVEGVNALLDEAALARGADPGPVVLRRLNNAEYTYTIRDLTGIESLDPAKEFPADSASGEGFMNVGNSLVMSPALVTKYLDAGKEIAKHAVLLPDGIAFSSSISARDWTDEKLAAIRAFYSRFTENGAGSAVNLQGIKFETKDGGVLPLGKYLDATLDERETLKAGQKSIANLARERGLNAKYLGTLWSALNDPASSIVLEQVRAQWRAAKPGEFAPLLATIRQWQQALWLFTSVGHIGKRDGPKAWQVPVAPLAASHEVRLKILVPTGGKDVTLYLVTSDAGDGNDHDFAVWDNPRLVAPGRPDLPLRDVRAAMNALTSDREKVSASAAECLAVAAEVNAAADKDTIEKLAQQHGVEASVLAAWLDYLGIGAGGARINSHLTEKLEKAESYEFIKGWIGGDSLSVIANSSDQHVRIPGNMKPHGIAVHPTPKLRVVVGWRSPVAATMHVEGAIQHAHTECGNGVDWSLELRRGGSRLRLAAGIAQDATEFKFGPFDNLAVQPGDVVCVSVGPREGNHACDLTAVELTLNDGTRRWDLSKDVSPDILAGNPHADSLGNPEVWHFYSEPDNENSAQPVLPAGSLLAKWRSSPDATEKQRLAGDVQNLLTSGGKGLAKEAPDSLLYRQLTTLNGPLVGALLRKSRLGDAKENSTSSAVNEWGVDPADFGTHTGSGKMSDTSLGVRAPSIIPVRLPAELVEGCELVATARLDHELGFEGSVQMQAFTSKPGSLELVAGTARERGNKGTWSDGELPVMSDSPILVGDGSAARKRFEAAFDDFRQLFPAALCYTKIVPVDEVVTLTLFYREDDWLRRLMLDDAQAAELDRLWAELHYISQDALKLVDGFEQLWEFATQDADPSAFEPLREPIKRRAEEFKKLLIETQPAQLDAVLKFAEGAYRRPLSGTEKEQLRQLYRRLREQELPHDQAIRLTLARSLIAPAFLYRAEEAAPGAHPGPVNDWELATRLSYFLWSSAPDAELRATAASGKLREPTVLAAQTRRMLRDPRVRRLATEFACAWLQIHDFESLDEKSERHFPTFAALRGPMYEEAIRFFTELFQQDASVLSILDADYTFLNGPLAEHYGIPGVAGPEWRRVEGVKKYGRGGVLGLGATLAKQSGASRTSPILRGNWVAEVLLGDRLPPPPKDVPKLPEEETTETLTVRQLVEKHASDPRCAGCHDHIDGYGFALEGYDAIGRLRSKDLGGRPIETRAKVFDGTTVEDAQGLRDYLLTKKRATVVGQFDRKLLGYALGRAVVLSDRPLLAEIRRQLEARNYQFSAAVEAIVLSRQFREIRGKEMAVED